MARRSYAGICKFGVLAAGGIIFASSASAGGIEPMPVVEAASPGHELELSANVALTTDYVFRGFSQTDESPAIQGGFDATYNIFYAGVWASNLDFGGDGFGNDIANIEIDYYAGITPTMVGLDWDFGVLYYTYPNAVDDGAELDYVEIYGGVSKSFMNDKLATGLTIYYSPDYTGEIGDNWVFEGTAGYTFDKISIFTPTLGGTLGFQEGDEDDGGFDYTYWNVGLTLAFYKDDMFALDLRYWDTDLSDATCSGPLFQCDERIVGTISASF